MKREDLPAMIGQPLPPGLTGTGRVAPRILAMSDDGSTVAWTVSLPVAPPAPTPRNAWVVVNRKAGPKFDEVRDDEVRVSANGRHIAYPALSKLPADQEPRWRVIHDGVAGAPYRGCGSLVFSPDGTHLAYLGVREDYAACVVLDGQECSPPLKPDAAAPLLFGPDSKHFAFGGVLPMVAGVTKWGIWMDGKQIAGDERPITPMQLLFSPNSQRLAVRMRLGTTGGDNRYAVMLDGAVGPEFFDILEGSLRFSDDSKRFVYVGGDANDNYFLIEEHKAGPAYNFIRPESVRFGADHLAFVAGTGPRTGMYAGTTSRNSRSIVIGRPTLFVDGQPLPGLGGAPVFSADGKRVAYFSQAKHPSRPFVVPCVIVDGKPDPPLQDVAHLQFSPNGKHYAYIGASNPGEIPRVLFIDGVAHSLPDGSVYRMMLDDSGAVTVAMDCVINNAHGIFRRIVLKP